MYIPQHLQNSAYFPLKTEEPKNGNYSPRVEISEEKDGWGDVHPPIHPFLRGCSVHSVSKHKKMYLLSLGRDIIPEKSNQ